MSNTDTYMANLERLYREVTLGHEEPDLVIMRSELRRVRGRKRRIRFVATPWGWMSLRRLKALHAKTSKG